MQLDLKKKIIIGSFICIIILISGYLYHDFTHDNYDDNINIDVNEYKNNGINENKGQLEESEKTTLKDKIVGDNVIIVHIAGAVKKPGIVKIHEGARLYEVIEQAEGTTEEADLSKVNLAYPISDGQKIYIVKNGETIPKQEDGSDFIISDYEYNGIMDSSFGFSSGETKEEKVNINEASQTELETLPGIGPSIAQKIIEYRQSNGKFNNIEDIQNVRGIGSGKFEDIKNYINV